MKAFETAAVLSPVRPKASATVQFEEAHFQILLRRSGKEEFFGSDKFLAQSFPAVVIFRIPVAFVVGIQA